MRARTTARIGDHEMSGTACESCGTAYDVCTQQVLTKYRPCCAHCGWTDTHEEQRVTAPQVPSETVLANLLWRAHEALAAYRRWADQSGAQRLALSDLATFEELESLAADLPDVDAPRWARERMADLIRAGEQPSLDGGDRHFGEALYGGHADEVRDALERLGLLPEEHAECADGCGLDVTHDGPCLDRPGGRPCRPREEGS